MARKLKITENAKLLVWVSVMQLYEQGKLELDRDISHYLPDGFLSNLSYDMPVTMLNLMNHNAGFQEVYADVMVTDADYIVSLEEALRKHKPAQIYKPGTVTAYSNWGVALAGFIVEQVSGVSFSVPKRLPAVQLYLPPLPRPVLRNLSILHRSSHRQPDYLQNRSLPCPPSH